jgi:hypothetical protein
MVICLNDTRDSPEYTLASRVEIDNDIQGHGVDLADFTTWVLAVVFQLIIQANLENAGLGAI